MFAAGLIRQESTFQADVVSHANAIGLMQILPKTGRILAKQRKVKYTKASLFDPNVNIQLGMLYIADLTRPTGGLEYAAAAYNAGEDRIALWKSERTYDEVPELVESIPFTETREYVQIVVRNAEMYRQIYGDTPKSTTVSAAIHPARLQPPASAHPRAQLSRDRGLIVRNRKPMRHKHSRITCSLRPYATINPHVHTGNQHVRKSRAACSLPRPSNSPNPSSAK